MNRRLAWFLGGGLLLALLLAGVLSNFASSSPDGLDATARKGCTTSADGTITGGTCMAQREKTHQMKDSPLADYGIRGIDNPYLSTGLSGVLGVLVTFGLGGGVFWLVRRRGRVAVTPVASAVTPPVVSGAPSPSGTPPAASAVTPPAPSTSEPSGPASAAGRG